MATQITMQQLAQRLKTQATPPPHVITIDDEVLGRDDVNAIIESFLLRENILLVVDPSTIPDNPPPTGFTLQGTLPSESSETFFSLTDRDCSIQFVMNNNVIDVVLTINPRSENGGESVSWKLSSSFGPQTFLFNSLPLEAPKLTFSTYRASATQLVGLNLTSTISLTGVLAGVQSLIGGGSSQLQLADAGSATGSETTTNGAVVLADMVYTLNGLISQVDEGATFDFQASLELPSIDLGFIEITSPFVGAQLVYEKQVTNGSEGRTLLIGSGEKDDDKKKAVSRIYVGAGIGVKNTNGKVVPLEFRAILPLQSNLSLMIFSVGPPPGLITSIDDLGSLIAGNTWDAFFEGPAAQLKPYVATFGLRIFTAKVNLTSLSIISLNVKAGITEPWQFFDNMFTIKTFDVDWTIISPTKNTIQNAVISTQLELFDDPNMLFGIEIILPDLFISGEYLGTASFTIADLIEKINEFFNTSLPVPPDDLATFSFSDFTTTIDVPGNIFTFSGLASITLNLFGLEILGLHNTYFYVTVNQNEGAAAPISVSITGTLVILGLQFYVSAQYGETIEFEIHMVDTTLGDLLNFVVHLVDPTFDIRFPSPWNKILDISMDALVLKISETKTEKKVSLTYETTIDLGFIKITGLGISYNKKGTQPGSTQIQISGSFFGQQFGVGSDNPPLGWDPINESPPDLPSGSPSIFDLQYAGLGQHIAFTGVELTTIAEVMAALQKSVLPSPSGALPPFGQNGLAFSAESNWLIGAQFNIMGTVAISAIFNDPNLYGILIQLSGEKAKIFAGLSFEILYRKVTETIGVYHIELKLPDAMRNLQFGSVSITLPVVVLDIYTNGNFRIDFGFPKGLDFSNSFSIQIFPFVGYGGFYFALLDGATSTRVPQITNGTFSPVIEFGFALSIGVGKTVNAGILSGGITVTVVGIIQGVLAWFNPTDNSPKEVYYWIQGTVAIVGRLYATINFAIIQATVDVTAYASVTLTIEAHQPIYIAISASVSVRVSVKIVFFTIHLSFKASVSASFTIGSASPTPWQLAPGSKASSSSQLQMLRGQQTLHAPRTFRPGYLRALRLSTTADPSPITSWPAVTVLPGGAQTITIWGMPGFTKSTTAGKGEAILILTAENSIPPDATTIGEHQVLHGSDPASAPFNLLMQGMLAWGIYVITNGASSVTADQLTELQLQLQNPETIQAAFDYNTLTAFLAKNFTFDVTPTTSVSSETGVALFPMIPAITLTDSAGTDVDFSTFNTVDLNYQEKVEAYFQLLQTQFDERNSGDSDDLLDAAEDGSISMATIVFARYFNMLMSSGVQASIDLLTTYPFTTSASSPMSIAEVGAAIGDADLVDDPLRVVTPNQEKDVLNAGAVLSLPSVVHQIRSGETFQGIAAAIASGGGLNGEGKPYTTDDLLNANLTSNGIFNVGTAVPFSGITYTTQANDTLNMIATRILIRAAGTPILSTIVGLDQEIENLMDVNPTITNPTLPIAAGTTITLSDGGSYITVTDDTLQLIAAYITGFRLNVVNTVTYVDTLLTANPNLPVTDPSLPQNPGTSISMPTVTRPLASIDTIASLPRTLLTTTEVIQAGLLAIPESTPLLAPQGVLNTPLRYAIASGDTFSGIAGKFDLTLQTIAEQATEAVDGTVPTVFGADQEIVISDLEEIEVTTLMDNLLNQTEWNNASGQVSRFLLSGLRLPDPNDAYFQGLTVEDLYNPANLGPIVTAPMFALTGQQYTIDAPPPSGYQITLKNQGNVSWLTFNSQSSTTFGLTTDQENLLNTVATTPLTPDIETLTRLALYQMVPSRIAILNHIAWQAAEMPELDKKAGGGTGNPSIWLFPDDLILKIGEGTGSTSASSLLYELVRATQTGPNTLDTEQIATYAWGTVVNIPISLPVTDGPTPSTANTYVINGADDTGANLLQQVYSYLSGAQGASDSATLYLLYSPNPSGGNPSGLISDQITAETTYLLKTNLSTLTHSSNTVFLEGSMLTGDPTDVYAAPISDVIDFIALLWEASITRSGGFFLNYTNANGGAGLPADVFGTESVASISLLILLDSQTETKDAPILPFNNCGVIGVNIDTTSSSVFAQPATYTVVEGDSLTTAQTNFNATWGTTFSVLDVATFNQDIPLLLMVGATMTIPGVSTPYEILYGDTLAKIVAKFNLQSLQALLDAGSNATAAILETGAQMQFADNILQPTATVPPGTVGFEITRTNPDPDNTPYDQQTPAQVVGTLFNLVGYNIAAEGDFIKSGAGLPTTPADSLQDQTDGLAARSVDDVTNSNWFYHQTLIVSPFSATVNGSASAALPSNLSNPYNGVGYNTAKKEINQVTIDLDMQDIYGNIQNLPEPYNGLQVPVGYFDNVINLGSWPSLAMAYGVSGNPVTVSLSMTMQQSRYIPGASVTVASALAAIAADLTSYKSIYYQVIQPDFSFALQTTLDIDSMSGSTPKYPLSNIPFLAFTYGAYIYLSTLSTMKQVGVNVEGTSTSVFDLTDLYGVTGAQLFTENQDGLYSQFFGTTVINVPTMYVTVEGNSLESIVADPQWSSYKLTVNGLAEANQYLPLNSGTDLVTPTRRATGSTSDSLNTLATRMRASAEGVANANATRTDILAEGFVFTVGTQSYTLGKNDSFANAASQLGVTVSALATANQWLQGLFVENASLDVTDVLTVSGDTIASLATTYNGGDVSAFATANGAIATIFAPGTSILIGANPSPTPPEADDTLLTFAQRNRVTVDQLGSVNATVKVFFADGATVSIPGVLLNDSQNQYATYTAGESDKLNDIAGKFGTTANGIAELNPDIVGLFLAGQTITDTTSGTSVTTVAGDTFDLIIQQFKDKGVTVTLQQLADDIATQANLIVPQSLWITPPMVGNAGGLNTDNTLDGLAAAYNSDVGTIATANGATLGFIASGVVITLNGISITTNEKETLNSIVNRLAEQGVTTTVLDVATAIASVEGLVAAQGLVTPIPSPSPGSNSTQISTKFSEAIFPINLNILLSRNSDWVDPDFETVASVASATYSVPPTPDPSNDEASFSLTEFATNLQGAIPGLNVATGDAIAEDDPASASTIWGVNIGNSAGPKLTYQFSGSDTAYFAIPPLSTALMGGKVAIIPYVQGQNPPFTGSATEQTFQSVDLDVWLGTFLQAIDVFLSPAYVTPAYALSPDSVTSVIQLKQELAEVISSRLSLVLVDQSQGLIEDAIDAMYQSLLMKLSNAFSIDTIVQVPVAVTSSTSDEKVAPRLSGKVTMAAGASATEGSGSLPNAFSFSTAKVAMTNPSSAATFLFSVKAPAEHKQANLDLQYSINELEIPDPTSTIGEYEGSFWLKFVIPLEDAASTIGPLDIPIPLRSYPSPVTLLTQTAQQSVGSPQSASELLGWDFDFTYQHNDAQQDTPLAAISFNAAQDPMWFGAQQSGLDLNAIFQALAQFIAVYPQLNDDLSALPILAPGTSNPNATAAVAAFAWLVNNVVSAWRGNMALTAFNPPEETYYYQMQKQETQEINPNLDTLTITAFDPIQNTVTPNPIKLWPDVYITFNGTETKLEQIGTPTNTAAVYQYPSGIPATTELPQRFTFTWPNSSNEELTVQSLTGDTSLGAVQTFQFNGTNILLRQNGQAGVLITRNLSLIPNVATNPAFIYQTPLTNFTSVAIPAVFAGNAISLGSGDVTGIASALGTFLETLFASLSNVSASETVTIRFGTSYSFALATTLADGEEETSETLNTLVPIALIPTFDFNPTTDWNTSVEGSFVNQIQAIVSEWQKINTPSPDGGSYMFDLTIYASQGQLQPLIQVTSLQYGLS
ncbi:MAG: LysM peptidoglycan-binding domain-containing protein [Candidatus Kapaibacterium sp.]